MSGVGNLVKKVGDAIFYGGDPEVMEQAKQAQQEQIATQNKDCYSKQSSCQARSCNESTAN